MAFGIPNIERIVSNVLEGGTGITAIREVEWDKNYLWAVDFIGGAGSLQPPAPFDDFFPVSDCSLGLGIVNSEEIRQGQSSFRFPRNTQEREISLTFYDNEQRTLQKWISDWINLDIFNNGLYVSGLEDTHQLEVPDSFGEARNVAPSRQISIAFVQGYRKEVIVRNYTIYPTGDFTYAGSQGSTATQYTVNFNIIEELKGTEREGTLFSEIAQILGRFI